MGGRPGQETATEGGGGKVERGTTWVREELLMLEGCCLGFQLQKKKKKKRMLTVVNSSCTCSITSSNN